MRARLVAAFVILITLMMVVQDWPLVNYLSGVERNQILTSLERDVWMLASQNDTSIAYGYPELIQDNFFDYAKSTESTVFVTDAKGVVLASTKDDHAGTNHSHLPEVVRGLDGKASAGSRPSQILGENVIYVAAPVEAQGHIVGVLVINYPEEVIDRAVLDRTRGIFLVALLTLAVTIFAAHMISKSFTRRLSRLQAATSRLTAGDLTVRVHEPDLGGGREIRRLEISFDKMVERLSSVLESQRTFASDASHQLRTPLTALRLQLENASRDLDDAAMTAERLETASEEVNRLQTLVDGLLTLARLEGHAGTAVEVDISRLLTERVDMWQPLAEEHGCRLSLEVKPGIKLLSHPGFFDQVVDAYLENALDFAPVGSTIEIQATLTAQEFAFHVMDAGPGLSEENAAKAFKRFWRGRTDGGGTGLGLAIVSRIGDTMGASYGIQRSPAGGADAYFKLLLH